MTRPFQLLALAVAFTTLAAPAANAADRPFKGHASGNIVALDLSTGAGIAQYEGQATHLGRFTRTEYFNLDGAGGISGCMIFVAANGDKLYLDFEGHFTSDTTVVGTYELTGGTGRFRDATGTANFEAVLSAALHVDVDFAGSIQY